MSSPDAVPVLVDFLNTVPQHLTSLLIRLSPQIAWLRHAAEIISWKASSLDSWLALAAWWLVCLGIEATLRYLLPLAIIALALTYRLTAPSQRSTQPITEHNLQATIANLNVLSSLLPETPPLPFPPTSVLFRAVAILYLPYIVLSYLIPLRIGLAIIGSVALSWRSPWASAIRRSLWQSAWFRWSIYRLWSRISGQPLIPPDLSMQQAATFAPEITHSQRYLFTIYENQRWWVGLDWTAALLPAERPSWCSHALQPIPPPTSFSLPDATTAYVLDEHGRRVKRTATWTWEETEWKVVVIKDGEGLSRVERPLPAPKEESSSVLAKVAGKMNQTQTVETEKTEPEKENSDDGELATDGDGWVYGDNKWEALSNKGGIGKYTRYRRWTRIAVVCETVEQVEDGDLGVERGRSTSIKTDSTTSVERSSDGSDRGSPLRQRLRTALNKPAAQ